MTQGGMALTREEVCTTLGLDAADAAWQEWGRSQDEASDDPLPLMMEGVDALSRACPDPELMGVLLRVAQELAATPAWRRLLWHVRGRVFDVPPTSVAEPRTWPALPEKSGEAGRLFYALVLLSGMRECLARHHQAGVPEDVTRDTLGDLPLWLRHYHDRHGQWGFAEMGWLTSHFTGRLYRLGRLQFRFERFPFDLHAFTERVTAQSCLLAGDGMRFRSDGQFDGADSVCDAAGAWTASFHRGFTAIQGHPVAPDGSVQRRSVTLGAADWTERLGVGDLVLGVHIPAIGPMETQACLESLRRAPAFFARHFPDYGYRAFTCESWLLDSQLAQYLPAESNIVAFQRLFLLHPVPKASARQTYERVLGSPDADPLAVSPRTSLQRAIAQHVRHGGHWREAGGIILPAIAHHESRFKDPGEKRQANE